MTRQWKSHKSYLKHFDLVLIDEVHLLNEKRGSTLEVIVSRMNCLQAELGRSKPIRFVAVSATAPNVRDIRDW